MVELEYPCKVRLMGMEASASTPSTSRRDTARRALKKAVAQNGMSFLVHGLPGMGKTWFIRELLDQARADGEWVVSYTSADEIEQTEPYSFIERVLAATGLPIGEFDPLHDPQVQPVAVGRAILRLFHELGGGYRYAMGFDDIQWADPQSAQVMRYLIPRLSKHGIIAVYGARTPHAPGSFGAHLDELTTTDRHHGQTHLAPLTVEEIRAFAAERLGATISPRSGERIHRATGGSILHAVAVFDRLTPAEVARLHMAWDIPLRGILAADNPLLTGYRELSQSARASTDIVCLSRNAISRSELAAAATQLGEEVCVDEAIRAGVVVESGFGATLSPVHALVAHAVRESLDSGRSRAVYRSLAEISDGYSSIRFRLEAAAHLDDDLVAQVRDYVDTAARNHAFAGIYAVLRRALALVPDRADPLRHELLVDLGLVAMQDKSVYLLLDLYDEYQALASESLVNELLAVMVAAYHPDQLFPQDKVIAMVMRPPTTPDDIAVQAHLAFMLVIMTMRTFDYSPLAMLTPLAKGLMARVPRDPGELNDARLGWMIDPDGYLVLLDCLDIVKLHRDYRMEETKAELPGLMARARALPRGALRADAIGTLAGAAGQAGDIALARELAAEAVEMLDHISKPWMASTARLVLADSMVLLGEIDAAAELVADSKDTAFDSADVESRPSFAGLGAIAAALSGKPEAASLARQAQALHDFTWEGYGPDLAVLADCEIARAAGNPQKVLDVISAAPVERMVNTRRGFLTHRTHALLDLALLDPAGPDMAGLDEAEKQIGQLAQWRGTRWAESWGSLAWLRGRLAHARGEHQQAQAWYTEALEVGQLPLPQALTMIDLAGVHRAMGRTDQARANYHGARTILNRIGATAYLPRCQQGLAELRSADRSAQDRLISELTAREREIATHLVKGRSNQQIAEELVVSVATIRFHVSNLLHKLQIRSRAEVARVLRGTTLDA